MNLKKLKTLYKERNFEIDDRDAWEEAIEKAWPKIERVIEAAKGIKRREEIGGYGHDGYTDLFAALDQLEDGE